MLPSSDLFTIDCFPLCCTDGHIIYSFSARHYAMSHHTACRNAERHYAIYHHNACPNAERRYAMSHHNGCCNADRNHVVCVVILDQMFQDFLRPSFFNVRNKLECLSLASLPSLVKCLLLGASLCEAPSQCSILG
jgi:hypothetical protein